MHRVLTAAFTVLVAPVLAQDAWQTDFAAAQVQAKAEGKSIVLDFTGSDWCGWCMTMRRTVLDTPAFYDYARNKFVLVEVDLPRNTSKMSAALIRQNNELVQRYQVSTFPSVLVVSAEGELLGGFTGGRTELAHVTQPLDLAATNAVLLRQAAEQSGGEKAQTLKTFYWNLPGTIRKDKHALRQRIAELDPQNTTGIHTEIQELTTIQSVTERIRSVDDATAISIITAALEQITAAHRPDLQQLLATRLNDYIQHLREEADSLDDIAAIRRAHEQLIELCVPQESRKQANKRLEAEFAHPQQMLDELRQEREYRTQYKK
jgi:protein disulfide-isomerase